MTMTMTMTMEEAIKPADRHGRARARAGLLLRGDGFRSERGILYLAARLPAFMLNIVWAMTLDDSAMAQAGVHV